ncbi:protein kinase, partial [Clonorchis sinensis]
MRRRCPISKAAIDIQVQVAEIERTRCKIAGIFLIRLRIAMDVDHKQGGVDNSRTSRLKQARSNERMDYEESWFIDHIEDKTEMAGLWQFMLIGYGYFSSRRITGICKHAASIFHVRYVYDAAIATSWFRNISAFHSRWFGQRPALSILAEASNLKDTLDAGRIVNNSFIEIRTNRERHQTLTHLMEYNQQRYCSGMGFEHRKTLSGHRKERVVEATREWRNGSIGIMEQPRAPPTKARQCWLAAVAAGILHGFQDTSFAGAAKWEKVLSQRLFAPFVCILVKEDSPGQLRRVGGGAHSQEGARSECGNHTRIRSTPVVTRLLASLVLRRLMVALETLTREHQSGFRPGNSCASYSPRRPASDKTERPKGGQSVTWQQSIKAIP